MGRGCSGAGHAAERRLGAALRAFAKQLQVTGSSAVLPIWELTEAAAAVEPSCSRPSAANSRSAALAVSLVLLPPQNKTTLHTPYSTRRRLKQCLCLPSTHHATRTTNNTHNITKCLFCWSTCSAGR